ncbi:hypothetical protein HFN89_00110 [Rhizobium laguerreae]|nr:hypothetical protein [Rhizobium laguerreae]
MKQERQGRSREANFRDAMTALIAMLDDHLRSGSKAAEDDVRRQQISSGMRGDKRRTYRFQDDTVVDHITGKSMQASKDMKGWISTLWSQAYIDGLGSSSLRASCRVACL